MTALAAGEPWAGMFSVRRKDGTELRVHVVDAPVKDEHGAVVGIRGVSQPTVSVLVVEDDRVLGGLLAAVLGDEGFTVTVATDPLEALRYAAEHAPDVVLFDLRMPDMDGRVFYEQLRAQGVTAHAVLCSAWSDGRAVADGMGVAFVPKPFDLDVLVTTLRHAVAVHAG